MGTVCGQRGPCTALPRGLDSICAPATCCRTPAHLHSETLYTCTPAYLLTRTPEARTLALFSSVPVSLQCGLPLREATETQDSVQGCEGNRRGQAHVSVGYRVTPRMQTVNSAGKIISLEGVVAHPMMPKSSS